MGSPCPAAPAVFAVFVLAAALAGSGCEGCEGGGLVDAQPDVQVPGTMSLAWSLTDTNGAPITCDQIGAVAVAMEIRELDAAVGASAAFTCSTGSGTTQALATGTYQVDIELVDGSGRLTALPRQTGIVVASGRDTTVGPVTFAVDAVGTLELFLRAAGTVSNCGPLNQMGAAWTGATISLARPGGVCQPATFAIASGATRPAGMYVASCPTPPVGPCIENDQKITAMNVPSDAYTIHIRGKINANDCWINDDPLQVPPLRRVLSRMLNLSKKPGPGC